MLVYPKAYAYGDHNRGERCEIKILLTMNLLRHLMSFPIIQCKYTNRCRQEHNYSPLSLYFACPLRPLVQKVTLRINYLALLGISDKEILSEQCGNLYRRLYKNNQIGKLRIANSIWMDDEFGGKPIIFKNEFVRQAAENFYASAHRVDFAKDETEEDGRLDINKYQW